jgi:hypothetical protein
MKRKLMIVALALVLVIMVITGVGTAATKYSNLKGTWIGKAPVAVTVATTPQSYSYTVYDPVTLIVTDQDSNGNFYGTIAFGLNWFPNPVTGTIATNKEIIMSGIGGDDRFFTFKMKLSGKTISGTLQIFVPVDPNKTDTGKIVLKKQP